MKWRRRYIFLLFLVIIIICKGFIYRFFIKYDTVGTRKSYKITNQKLIETIENTYGNPKDFNIENILTTSKKVTNTTLSFTYNKCDLDPNRLIQSKATNCIGYANFYASVCNYLIEKHGLSKEWNVNTHIAKLYFLNVNVHDYFESPFFKDHDFVVIEHIITGDKHYIDPSVSDYLGIDSVSIR